MNRDRLRPIAFCLLLALSSGSARAQNLILPAPEQLVTLSIQQRLELMQSMNALPPKQREANLNALREEIDSLSPNQKQEMADHFQSEFQALPKDEQDKLRAVLAEAHEQAGAGTK